MSASSAVRRSDGSYFNKPCNKSVRGDLENSTWRDTRSCINNAFIVIGMETVTERERNVNQMRVGDDNSSVLGSLVNDIKELAKHFSTVSNDLRI